MSLEKRSPSGRFIWKDRRFGVKHLHLGKIPSGSKGSVIFTWVSAIAVLLIGVAAHLFLNGSALNDVGISFS